MIKKHVLYVMGALSLYVIFPSCKQEVKQRDEEVTTDTLSAEARESIQLITVNIPSPVQMSAEMSKAGFPYNKGLLNSTSRASSYSTNYQTAMNLGVFGADLAYAAAYDQTQDVIEYLSKLGPMAEKVGVAAAFDQTFAKRFQANVSNKDSLTTILNDAFGKAERNLRSNQRVSSAAMVVTGAWVEGLYVATQLLKGKERDAKNEELYKRVWNHVYSLKYITQLLNAYKSSNADCSKLLDDLKGIRELAERMESNANIGMRDVDSIQVKVVPIRGKVIS